MGRMCTRANSNISKYCNSILHAQLAPQTPITMGSHFHMRPVASHATGGSHEAIGAVVREDRVEEPKDAHKHRTWDD